MAEELFLVTGALGCIGAWTCATLAEERTYVVGFDVGANLSRLRLATDAEIPLVRGDITDRASLERVLDAAKSRGIRVAYASSAAVYSQADDPGGPVPNDAVGHPTTFYGVHKQACEGLARIFWQEEGVASIGIRPWIVYGPGRDTGLTASPTLAMAAAARGEDYEIAFGGRTQLQFAPDAARAFVAAARAAADGARVFHLGGPASSLEEVASAIEAAAPGVSIAVDAATVLPFPEEFDGAELDRAIGPISWTPLAEGVRRTIDRLRAAPA